MRTVIEIRQDENWWGGATASGACPLHRESVYHEDLIRCTTSASNQAMPMYVSDKGRYIWSDEPFDVRIEDGCFVFEGGEIALVQAGDTLREAYLACMEKHFPCDGRVLADEFFTAPQYNTWMEFTYYPTQEKVLRYAHDILSHGFPPGILILDEGWQRQYGAWEFDPVRFPAPREMVDELHRMGFKVMVWVVPYVRADGVEFVRSIRPLIGTDPEAAKHIYIRTREGSVACARWWNGYSALLDMTNEYDARFLDDQLRRLMRETGVDGFKFDGGAVDSYLPGSFINGEAACEHTPYELNRAWNEFGLKYRMHEFKDSYGMGGRNAIQRLRDKGHRWDGDGLALFLPSALIAGMIGHPFLCPDMIGGGEWSYRYMPGFVPDAELFVRMAQCSALFPMMQFSWAVWDELDEEMTGWCRDAALLHERFADRMLALVRESERTGEAIMRPLEYNDPGKGNGRVTDEFMLGRDILVCPVLKKGQRERDVIFPGGTWRDEEGNLYEGDSVRRLSAPLSRLLWFERADK